LQELFANVRQVVYQLSNQRQNIVTKTSPGRPLDLDVVYQLARGTASSSGTKVAVNPGLQAPANAPSTVGPASVQKSTPSQAPVRLAALDSQASHFINIKSHDAPIEIVRPIENPDLIWDPISHDVIAWGDVVAYHVDPSDIISVIDRTAAVRELKAISNRAPQPLRLSGDDQHHNDDVVRIELSDVAGRSIVLLNIASDGTVQMLHPLGSEANQGNASTFQKSLRVRGPFGADQIVAVTATEPLATLLQALSELDRRRAPAQVIKSLLRYMPENARIGSIGIFTAP
jgi:hypothetical protein